MPRTEIGYVKFESVDGSATESKHKNWSKVYSLSSGVTRPAGGNAAGTVNDRTTIEEITVEKEYDKASPPLFQKTCEGKVFGKVEIELTTSTGNAETYLKYELEDARITGYSQHSTVNGNEVSSTDVLRLSFKKVKIEFTSMDDKGNAGGKAQGTWNIADNKA